ncbi:AAA family ATPase [Microterricola pindariensis]|uniref:Regulator n=1 Tax=Microterricola pindariensis TaxID=478010 RepID=A0ABX5AZB8_9MICO|nr:tyrosine-protein kinase family protein [Microterricola pindariensis]PPL20162.1 regulator [Microterricola pindariensis]
MATLALALDARTEDRLLADILEHGHRIAARLGTAREVVAALDASATGGIDVVLVSATAQTLGAELLAACDRRGIRLIALASDAAERAHAARIGLHEVLGAAAPWTEIEAQLGAGDPGPPEPRPAQPVAGRGGTVIVVWGPAGAPGRTTVAVNIAAEIAALGRSVVLADADSYGGSVAPVLGLLDESPGFAAACRLGGGGGLNRAELERVAERYPAPPGALWVLTGIGRAERWPELGAEKVAATIEACRDWVEYTVVDIGFCLERDEEIASDLFAPRRNAAAVAALAAADHVVAVGLADPVGMSRFLRGFAALPEYAPTASLSVVINRVRASAIGLDPHGQVRQTLRRFGGIEQATLLPHELNALDTAVLEGRTLRDAAPRSAVLAGIRRLVTEELVPGSGQLPRRRMRRPRCGTAR